MRTLLVWIALCAASTALAFEPARFTPNVVDTAGALSRDEIRGLNADIQRLREEADLWAAVSIVDTLGDESIESAAEITFRRWELGEKGKDNGVLLIFALQDRNARIEVGYGLEGDITDLHAKRVLDEVILLEFKSERYASGIRAGLYALGYLKTRDAKFLDRAPGLAHQGELLLRAEEAGSSEGFTEEELARGFEYWKLWALLVLGLPFALRLFRAFQGRRPPGRGALSYVLGLDMSLVIRLFLLVNPGVFILIAPAMTDALPPEAAELARSPWPALRPVLSGWIVWGVALFLGPLLVRVPAFLLGRHRPNRNPVFQMGPSALRAYLLDLDGINPVIQKLILALVPGLFAGFVLLFMTEGAPASWLVQAAYGGMALVFLGYQVRAHGLTLLSDRRYWRYAALKRLRRIHTRVEGTRQVFGRTHSYTPSRSSSSGSSSSSSSSSGGGRSGGGGASSRW
ncbi:MAG: TPM domain-containing protein [Bdellovibrionales bacterium]|nr:TPM domain-containing protein [Bdellovibrionales bacterium]